MSEDTKNEGNDLLNDDTVNEEQGENQVQGDGNVEANSSEGADENANADDGSNDPEGASDDPASKEEEPSQENNVQPNVPVQAPARENAQDVGISYQKMTQEMKEHLASQPKVHFMIPLGEGEKSGAYETVQINGYKMTIKKGVMVVIPQQVAEILGDHYRITSEVGQEWLIGRDDATEKALV